MNSRLARYDHAKRWLKIVGQCVSLGGGMIVHKPNAFTPSGVTRPGDSPRGAVAVIGGAGYIGSVLIRKLLCSGRKVRVLDSLVFGDEPIRATAGHPNLEVIVGDCRSVHDVASVLRSADSVVHLAAIVGDPACQYAPEAAIETNFSATRMVAEVARGLGIRRFVFASSCSVYGATEEYVDETAETRPVSLYARTKLDCENFLLGTHSSSFHPVILRLATVFGDSYRPRFDLAVNLITAKAWATGKLTIYNGSSWRPFIHVQDVAEGIVSVLNADQSLVGGQILNLGDSALNYTLTGVAEEIQRAVPGSQIEHASTADRRNYRVRFDKIRERLGFRCSVGIREGVAEIVRAVEGGSVRNYLDVRYNNYEFIQKMGPPAHSTVFETVIPIFPAGGQIRPVGALP